MVWSCFYWGARLGPELGDRKVRARRKGIRGRDLMGTDCVSPASLRPVLVPAGKAGEDKLPEV